MFHSGGTNATIATLMHDLTLAPFGPKDQVGQSAQLHVGNNQETLLLAKMLLAKWNRTRL